MSNDATIAESRETGTSETDRFYRAYGRAMLSWQLVETALFRFYFGLFTGGNLNQVGSAYYSLNSFGAKLHLVSATAPAILRGDQRRAWTAILRDLKTGAEDRNILAHRAVAIAADGGSELALVLAPPYFAPKHLRRKLGVRYDAAACDRLAEAFEALAGRIDGLCAACSAS